MYSKTTIASVLALSAAGLQVPGQQTQWINLWDRMVYDVDATADGKIIARDYLNKIYWYNAECKNWDLIEGQPNTTWYVSVDDVTGRAIVIDAWFKVWVQDGDHFRQVPTGDRLFNAIASRNGETWVKQFGGDCPNCIRKLNVDTCELGDAFYAGRDMDVNFEGGLTVCSNEGLVRYEAPGQFQHWQNVPGINCNKVSHTVEKGLWATMATSYYCANWDFDTQRWNVYDQTYCIHNVLASGAYGRPFSTSTQTRYLTTLIFPDEHDLAL